MDTLKLFVKSELVHEGRAANVEANRLAKSSNYLLLGRHVWFPDLSEGVCTSYSE
jgi:hypothetical protein